MARSRALYLLFLAGITIIAMMAAFSPTLPPLVRLPLAVGLVALAPGAALTATLFARRSIGVVERIALSISLSLAIAALGGVVLHATSIGLRTETWAIMLGCTSLGATAIAAILSRNRQPAEVRTPAPRQSARHALVPVLMLALALSVTVGAIAMAQDGARKQQRPGFTQLWLAPGATGDPVTVGIQNHEGESILVRLEITTGRSSVAEFPAIMISDGERWERPVTIPDGVAQGEPLVATLFMSDDPESVFRQARLWPG